MQVHIHCVYLPGNKLFKLSANSTSWSLTPDEFIALVRDAKDQLVDTTDAVVEYSLKCANGGINFKKGRNAFTGVVKYLQKVLESWENYKRLSE